MTRHIKAEQLLERTITSYGDAKYFNQIKKCSVIMIQIIIFLELKVGPQKFRCRSKAHKMFFEKKTKIPILTF